MIDEIAHAEKSSWRSHHLSHLEGSKIEKIRHTFNIIKHKAIKDKLLYGVSMAQSSKAQIPLVRAIKLHDILEEQGIDYSTDSQMVLLLKQHYTTLGFSDIDAVNLGTWELVRWQAHHDRNYKIFLDCSKKQYELMFKCEISTNTLDLLEYASRLHDAVENEFVDSMVEDGWHAVELLLSLHYQSLQKDIEK